MSRLALVVSAPVFSAVALLVTAGPALAGSPAMSVKSGSSTACGGPGAVCVPGNDVFNIPNVDSPVVVDTLDKLGLQAGDNITSISCRGQFSAGAHIIFSVTSGSVGAGGTAPNVASEAAAGEVGADIFDGGVWGAPTPNRLLVDDDGTITNPAGSFAGLGLEPTDDIDALAGCDLSNADTENIYFTLGPGSPTIALVPTASTAAVFVKAVGSPGLPTLGFQAAHFGLLNTDILDGFVYDVGLHKAAYSLAPGSPSLLTIPALPGDILQGFGTPSVFITGATLGLAPGDDIDGLAMFADADSDLTADGKDNCPGVANNDQYDTDHDNTGDRCDDSDLDGTVDPDDNCPDYPNPAQTDTDGDGQGQECDPCTNLAHAHDATSAKISLSKINTDLTIGDDGMKISARFVIASTFAMLEPNNRGALIEIRSAAGDVVSSTTVPYGDYDAMTRVGWSTNGKVWLFKDKSGSPANGVTGVKIVDQSKKAPGLVQMTVTAKGGNFPVLTADSPLSVTVVPGDQYYSSLQGDCGDATFTAPKCKFNGAGNKVSCKLP